MRSRTDRFTGTFSDDRDTIRALEQLDADRRWQPWMEVTLTREELADPRV
jgi:hypothetical protein